jgi:hypothetical protein
VSKEGTGRRWSEEVDPSETCTPKKGAGIYGGPVQSPSPRRRSCTTRTNTSSSIHSGAWREGGSGHPCEDVVLAPLLPARLARPCSGAKRTETAPSPEPPAEQLCLWPAREFIPVPAAATAARSKRFGYSTIYGCPCFGRPTIRRAMRRHCGECRLICGEFRAPSPTLRARFRML